MSFVRGHQDHPGRTSRGCARAWGRFAARRRSGRSSSTRFAASCPSCVRHPSHAPAPPAARRGLHHVPSCRRRRVHRARRPLRRRPRAVMDVNLPRGVAPRGRRAERGGVPAPRRAERHRRRERRRRHRRLPLEPGRDRLRRPPRRPRRATAASGRWARSGSSRPVSEPARGGGRGGVRRRTPFPARSRRGVGRLSDAVTFAIDNARRFGGSGDKVTLVGHSAGAHICAMALLAADAEPPTTRATAAAPAGDSAAAAPIAANARILDSLVGSSVCAGCTTSRGTTRTRMGALVSGAHLHDGARDGRAGTSTLLADEACTAACGGASYSDAPESDADARASSDASSPLTRFRAPTRRRRECRLGSHGDHGHGRDGGRGHDPRRDERERFRGRGVKHDRRRLDRAGARPPSSTVPRVPLRHLVVSQRADHGPRRPGSFAGDDAAAR